MSREDHVCDLSTARGARVSNTNHDLGIVVICKSAAAAGNDRPDFANHLGAGRNHDRVGDDINTGIEKYDLAAGELVWRAHKFPNAHSNIRAHTFEMTFLMACVSSVLPSPFAP